MKEAEMQKSSLFVLIDVVIKLDSRTRIMTSYLPETTVHFCHSILYTKKVKMLFYFCQLNRNNQVKSTPFIL